MLKTVFALVLGCLFALAGPTCAFAAAAVATGASPTTIDVSPFLGDLLGLAMLILGPAIVAVAGMLVTRLYKLLGIKMTAERDADIRHKIEQILDWSVQYGRAQVKAAGPLVVDTRSAIVAAAAGYAMRSGPKALKDLGIVDVASKRLAEMIEARLGPDAV